jgi:HK97 family phage prohead protease
MNKKQFLDSELTLDEGSRTVLAIINTDRVDRDNEVVLPSGLVRMNYAGNPVVMWGHDYSSLPIGTTQWVKQDGKSLLAKYRVSDKTQFARDVWGLLQDGVLRAHSIGFIPIDQSPPTQQEMIDRPELKDCRNIVRKWELLEFSLVAIPCNADALAVAVSKGYDAETMKMFGEVKPELKPSELITSFDGQYPLPKEAPMWIDEPQPLAKPKYCRSWKTIEQQLQRVISTVATESELLDMIRGRV